MRSPILVTLIPACLALSACNEAMRPQVSSLDSSMGLNGANTITMPTVAMPEAAKPQNGAIWVPGSRQFFKDSRAHAVGDIVTITVEETASASSKAATGASRSHDQQSGILGLLNLGSKLVNRGIPLASNGLVDTTSDRSFTGNGNTTRQDTLSGNIAAVVTQVMPNGLMVIRGQREVLVNYEKQIMTLQGIIRQEDITSVNTISSQKIAEARIAYSGNGLVDEAQTPQYGVRLLDKVLPF